MAVRLAVAVVSAAETATVAVRATIVAAMAVRSRLGGLRRILRPVPAQASLSLRERTDSRDPLDRGGANGNFGINEGLNLARPLGDPWGCGYQIGANFVQSDFSGASVVTADGLNLRAPFRKQYFVTAGIFQRAICRGFQWGVAYDYLHDIYYENANLQQIRSETGLVLDKTYEIGYYGAYGVGDDKDRVINGRLDPTDMFVLFIRRNFENGGDGRIWGGATGNGDGLLGADLWVPLGKGFALENRINYMIPKQGRGDTAQTRESWGLIDPIGLVSRTKRQVPAAESVPPDLQRGRQLAVHGRSVGQIAVGFSP